MIIGVLQQQRKYVAAFFSVLHKTMHKVLGCLEIYLLSEALDTVFLYELLEVYNKEKYKFEIFFLNLRYEKTLFLKVKIAFSYSK